MSRRASVLLRAARLVGTGVLLAAALWWRRNPSACPYGQRFWVELPHPFVTRARLREALDPKPGERVLEVGPGTGYYSLEVAQRLAPGGALDILDLQQEMLDHTMGRARERGIAGIAATRRRFPTLTRPSTARTRSPHSGRCPTRTRRCASWLASLSRAADSSSASCSAIPTGCPSVADRAQAAGLSLERRVGGRLGYYARFLPERTLSRLTADSRPALVRSAAD